MSIKNRASRRTERLLELTAPITRDITVERGIKIPMRDGIVLLAERWRPCSGGNGLPVAFLRSPYPLSNFVTAQIAKPLAERGFQVLMQYVRGICGSGGKYEVFHSEQERMDGLDSIDWICRQPWYGEGIVLFGPSYHGFVQWAMADDLPSQVKAIVPSVTSSDMAKQLFHDEVFCLEAAIGWSMIMELYKKRFPLFRFLLSIRKVIKAFSSLPIVSADMALFGYESDIMQTIFAYPESPLFDGSDVSRRVSDVTVPTSIISGWYDVFLKGAIRDFTNLQNAGCPARLTIGNWNHNSTGVSSTTIKELLDLGMANIRDESPSARAAVRLFVMGAEEWREFSSWPPPGYEAHPLYLQPDRQLAEAYPPVSQPDSYRYDPADPTPAYGGARMLPGFPAGSVDNTKLESRSDVLIYTGPELSDDFEMVGEVSAQIWFQSDLPYADLFVRVCDVAPGGRSFNICDGLIRINHADKLQRIHIVLSPTAYMFKLGHRIRVQVSSGAFPQYNRNTGTGEPFLTTTRLQPARQKICHDPEHASLIFLPKKTGLQPQRLR